MMEKPMLAKEFQLSEDRKVYKIVLRDGVKFHDGSTMSADDVVASFKRWGEMSAVGKRLFKSMEEVKAVDAQTVEIAFKEPYAPLIR
ncbi:ABC transporter substrate-binding protein, partial [Bacillus sp. SIMBA_069]